MLKIRRPLGRLIFNMGIAIPGKTVFLIETAPWCLLQKNLTYMPILACMHIYAKPIQIFAYSSMFKWMYIGNTYTLCLLWLWWIYCYDCIRHFVYVLNVLERQVKNNVIRLLMQIYHNPVDLAIWHSAPVSLWLRHNGKCYADSILELFSSMKIVVFWLRFHWHSFLRS